jgi:hypothetical protein
MAAQAALIADTIIGMKRALRRETECTYLRFPICPTLAINNHLQDYL